MLDVLFSAGRFEAESALILEFAAGRNGRNAGQGAGRHAGLCRLARGDGPVAGFPMHRGVLAIGRRRDDESGDRLLAALPAPRAGDRAGRHLQPRQYGRDLPQRRRLRRRRGAARRDLLRPALPQGDPRLGGRGAEDSVRVCRHRTKASQSAGRARLQPDWRCRPAARPISARSNGASGWRSISAPKATACPPICWRGLQTVRIPMAAGFDSLNVAAASAIALHEIRNRERVANSE